jgi:hypothetical protein
MKHYCSGGGFFLLGTHYSPEQRAKKLEQDAGNKTTVLKNSLCKQCQKGQSNYFSTETHIGGLPNCGTQRKAWPRRAG